jgi:hypothetical protein
VLYTKLSTNSGEGHLFAIRAMEGLGGTYVLVSITAASHSLANSVRGLESLERPLDNLGDQRACLLLLRRCMCTECLCGTKSLAVHHQRLSTKTLTLVRWWGRC